MSRDTTNPGERLHPHLALLADRDAAIARLREELEAARGREERAVGLLREYRESSALGCSCVRAVPPYPAYVCWSCRVDAALRVCGEGQEGLERDSDSASATPSTPAKKKRSPCQVCGRRAFYGEKFGWLCPEHAQAAHRPPGLNGEPGCYCQPGHDCPAGCDHVVCSRCERERSRRDVSTPAPEGPRMLPCPACVASRDSGDDSGKCTCPPTPRRTSYARWA